MRFPLRALVLLVAITPIVISVAVIALVVFGKGK